MMQKILNGLNPAQAEAVQILHGPLLILAGAGSGKTKCLTHRIAYLIANGVSGNQILAVTFTNKAAAEMKGRVEKLLSESEGFDGRMPAVGTFHSICVRILRQDIDSLGCGLDKNFVIFDTSDTQSLMKRILKERGYDEKEVKHRAVLSHISTAKSNLQTPPEYADNTETNRFTRVVKDVYPIYQKRLQEHNAVDFDDLLQKVVQVLENSEDVLKKYRKRWNHLMIDEYQDTNFAQYRIVRLLGDEHKNICAIGDDHQSIYSFRGADFTNILNFEHDFPDAKIVKLEQNYRSTGCILDNANCLIRHNKTGREKKLWTESQQGSKLWIQETGNEKEEGRFIVEKMRELVQDENFAYGDCVFLYRMNAQSRALEEACMRYQIPYQIVGGTKFFDRKEVKDVLAYLRLIFNPRDDVSFVRIVNVPARKIGNATLEVVREYAKNYSMGMYEVLQYIDDIEGLNDGKKTVLKNFYKKIESLRISAQDNPISILLDRLIESIEYLKFLDDGSIEGESRVQNVREMFSVAGRYDGAEESLAAFLEGVALVADIDNLDQDQPKITLMTIHASKGLEFPVVFLPGWEEGVFPSSNSQMDNEALEEERRLGYVAITRAEQRCFITYTKQRMLYGQTNYSVPSQFLGELDDKACERHGAPKNVYTGASQYRQKRENPAAQYMAGFVPKNKKEAVFGVRDNESEYSISDKIRHPEWGEGTIIQISGDVLSVAFVGQGIKKIVASVAPIEKI